MKNILVKKDEHREDIILFFDKHLDLVPKKGIVHVGAHKGQEVEEYLNRGFQNIVLVEANPEHYEYLKDKFSDYKKIKIFHYAVTDKVGIIDFYVHVSRTGSTEPASILPMKRFKEIVKTLYTKEIIKVPAITIDDLFYKHNLTFNDYNFINIDIQGAELIAFKGASRFLKHVDVVITEVDLIELYEKGCLEREVIEYLSTFNFQKAKAIYHTLYDESGEFPAWGEVLLIKKKSLPAALLAHSSLVGLCKVLPGYLL